MRAGRPPKFANSRGEWQCSKCKEWKPAEDYNVNVRASNGRASQCKACSNQYQKASQARIRAEHRIAELREQWPAAPQEDLERFVTLQGERSQVALEARATKTNCVDQVLEITKRLEEMEVTFFRMGYHFSKALNHTT